jgi:hypothetical protein
MKYWVSDLNIPVDDISSGGNRKTEMVDRF